MTITEPRDKLAQSNEHNSCKQKFQKVFSSVLRDEKDHRVV